MTARRAAGDGSVHKRKQGGWQGSIEVAVYFADGAVNMYQMRQWYKPLAELSKIAPVAKLTLVWPRSALPNVRPTSTSVRAGTSEVSASVTSPASHGMLRTETR